MNLPPSYVYAIALVIAAVGAVIDVRSRTLPNSLCVALAGASMLALALVGDVALVGSGLIHAVIALLVGMVLFKLSWIGGGDAKFYAAAALGLPLSYALPLLGWTSIGGLGLLVAMVAMRVATGRRAMERGWSVPYGAAIFLGFAGTLGFSSLAGA